MKRLAFRLIAAILTFIIGVASTLVTFKNRPRSIPSSNNLNTQERALPILEPKQISLQSHSSKNLIKIADVPSDLEHDSFSMQLLNKQEIWISSKEKMWRTRNGGRGWELIYNGRKGADNITNDIIDYQFINSKVGWLLVIEDVPITKEYSDFKMRFFKTEDGGDTWKGIAHPVAENFNSFHFLDEKHGWAAGSTIRRIPKNETRFIRPRNIFMGKEALYAAIYYTEDGGTSWQQQSIPSRPNSISDLSMLDTKHGWAWGDAGDFYLDGGRWKEISYDETECNNRSIKVQHLEIDAGNPYVGATGVSFINSKVGWMSHSLGYLAKTTDGGRTWCDLIKPEVIWGKQEFPMNFFYGIKFFDPQHGYGFDEQSLYETDDGGITWTKLDFETGTLGASSLTNSC